MRNFNFKSAYTGLLTPKIVNYMTHIHELKVQHDLFIETNKSVLSELIEITMTESVDASNRIDGIKTADNRIRNLVLNRIPPINQSENEIAGYRDIIMAIYGSHDYIPTKPSGILRLHHDLYKYSGKSPEIGYTDSENIVTNETTDTMNTVANDSLVSLCRSFEYADNDPELDPLLLIPIFILDFLRLHPFDNVTGRISRLLLLILLGRSGYMIWKYISIEKLIYDNIETYNRVLQESSDIRRNSADSYAPFVAYVLDIIETAYRNFADRNGLLSDLWFTKPDRVRNVIREHGGRISKREIAEKCQDISQITIQRTLIELQKSGEIIKLCGGRYASYVWKGTDMTDKKYNAKSANEHHGAIPVREHCGKVSALSAKFGGEFGKSAEASVAGIFHDFGKYSDTFADVLNGRRQNVDHAFPGAAFLHRCLKLYGQNGSPKWIGYEPIIESVAGHHDGLSSLGEMSGKLECTYESSDADCCPSGKFPSLRGKAEFSAAKSAFREDFPEFRFTRPGTRDCENMVEDMLDTRMLFSCLVDADYSVSASDDDPDYLKNNSREPIDADSALIALESHRSEIKRCSVADKELNALRDSVFEMCGKAGELPRGLFTLTAPTGVGKTLAMLNFALRHCAANSMRRVIVVLPFLTLAEQTEKEYRKIFPDILVDHSQKELPDELRELSARWDYPVVITTSVRFFESLFADKPSDCRKLHNIANSVVLFDESQSLPAELAPATIKAVNALCKKYNCSMVFSTATQPDFGSLKDTGWCPTEIVPDNKSMFDKTRRVRVEWRLFANNDISRNPTFADIASEMAEIRNVCAIVNLRAHARELFGELRRLHGNDGLYLLTTDLCPAHRLEVVKEIKARQNANGPCIVVATQCIEAGVDLDFDVMFRALAPLEGIIQAAGRCNRNKRLECGRVVVFQPDADGNYPGDSYGRAAGIVKNLWANDPELDISDPDVITGYYRRFFSESHTDGKLDKAINDKDYAGVAKEYRLIKNSGVQLIVPWSGEIDLFNEIKDAKKIDHALLRKAAPITVGCYDIEFVRSVATQIKIGPHNNERPTGYYILNTGFYDRYDPVMGLQVSGNTDKLYMC